MMEEDESFDEIDLTSIQYKEKEEKPEKPEKVKKAREIHVPESQPKFEHKQKKQKDKPTDDDIKRKRQLILHLGMYINQFPEELKQFKKVNLEKKSIEELQDLLKEFHVIMDSKSDLKGEIQAAMGVLSAYEYVMVEYAGVQCQGLTVGLSQDKDTIKQLKLLILKHSPLITVEPEARLIMKVLMTTMQLHTINTYNQQITQTTNNNEKINTINQEFNDI